MRPRIRSIDKEPPPYLLNHFSDEVIRRIGRELIYAKVTRASDSFEGNDWERTFARAIDATWKPSNVGLDDVYLGNCCWGAKSVKCTSPHTAQKVRLISGRNSLDYSFDVADVRNTPLNELGAKVLSIWNERVKFVQSRFRYLRTVVLMKGPRLGSGTVFEFETEKFDASEFRWNWNARKNLEGRDAAGIHRFTWQPHGSQFTVIEQIPEVAYRFNLRDPEAIDPQRILNAIGYTDDWVQLLR